MTMAAGYVHSSDRLARMMGAKLVSEGRLAEMAGPSLLETAIYVRTVNLKSVAENLFKNVSPENRVFLERQ